MTEWSVGGGEPETKPNPGSVEARLRRLERIVAAAFAQGPNGDRFVVGEDTDEIWRTELADLRRDVGFSDEIQEFGK